jgi:hypothetical protein
MKAGMAYRFSQHMFLEIFLKLVSVELLEKSP